VLEVRQFVSADVWLKEPLAMASNLRLTKDANDRPTVYLSAPAQQFCIALTRRRGMRACATDTINSVRVLSIAFCTPESLEDPL